MFQCEVDKMFQCVVDKSANISLTKCEHRNPHSSIAKYLFDPLFNWINKKSSYKLEYFSDDEKRKTLVKVHAAF